jgi:diguanylate cyclase (GGDEF)-like protein
MPGSSSKPPPVELANMKKQQCILIVDDTKINRDFLAGVLQAQYKVIVAKRGEQALKAAQKEQNQPDLILLDIIMPGMNGYEVCQRLKENPLTQNLPVIFVTSMDDIDDETKGFALGAVDYISKPVSPPILLARVKNHLRMKRKSDLLEQLASLDGLTEIPNRRSFDENLRREWNRARRSASTLSLVMMDVDYFKQYNDNYGHGAGDECLKQLANALTGAINRPSDFIARYGGEEFCAILPETDREGARKIAESFRLAVADLAMAHDYSEVSQQVTISVGTATTTVSEAHAADALLKLADDQLYSAKMQGRNRTVSAELIG